MQIEIATVTTTNGPRLQVRSPYHPDFPQVARALGGRWNPAAKVWLFDPRDEVEVRKALRSVYGTDGSGQEDLVDVEYRLAGEKARYYTQSIWAFGRELAYRPFRDAPVRLGEGVRILEGGFPASAGSRKSPAIGWVENTVLLVRDVPRPLALQERERLGGDAVIRGENPSTDVPEAFRRAMEEEKE